MKIESHLIQNPTCNSARAFNSGVRDAASGTYRPPVESMIGAYHSGWVKVCRLPSNAR